MTSWYLGLILSNIVLMHLLAHWNDLPYRAHSLILAGGGYRFLCPHWPLRFLSLVGLSATRSTSDEVVLSEYNVWFETEITVYINLKNRI